MRWFVSRWVAWRTLIGKETGGERGSDDEDVDVICCRNQYTSDEREDTAAEKKNSSPVNISDGTHESRHSEHNELVGIG